MQFCPICDNKYYAGIDGLQQDKLVYYCRYCGHRDEQTAAQSVLRTNFRKNERKFHHVVNKYTKYDPTLPRIGNVPCPNQLCATHAPDASTNPVRNEVVFFRYDDENMKYLYICAICDTVWKTDDRHDVAKI